MRPTIQNFNSSSTVSKILKPVIALLRTRDISLIIYLDDLLIAAGTYIDRLNHTKQVISLLESLGFRINYKKSIIIPTQNLEFLGFIIDSTSMSLALPVGKIQSIKSSARKLLRAKGTISIRQLSRFIGLCTSAKYAVPQAPLHYRLLQFPRNSVLKGRRYSPTLYNLEVHLSPEAITDLKWWADHLQYHSKTPIRINDPDLIITSDASDLGWGAWCGEKSVQGLWSQEKMFWHINPRELQAAYLALKIFSPSQINQLFHIQLQIDNQAAVSYINHLRGTHSKLLCQLSLDLWNWSLSRQIHISARYIPSIFNKHADHMSRRLKLTAEWNLNPIMFQRIVAVYGMPQIDLFATRANTQLRKFVSWIPSECCNRRVQCPVSYVFPPFSLIMRCVQRIKNQKGKILLVIPAWRSRPWYPLLFSLLYDQPLLLPNSETTLLPPSNQKALKPQLNINKLTLAVRPLSGNASLNTKFLRECPKSYLPHGAQEQNLSINPVGENGIAALVENPIGSCIL